MIKKRKKKKIFENYGGLSHEKQKMQIILKNQALIYFKSEPKGTRFVRFEEYATFKNRTSSYLCFFPYFFL